MNEIFCPPYEVIQELIPGHLYKAIAPDSGDVVAIRLIRVGSDDNIDSALLVRLQAWVDTMIELNHPHIARLIDVKHGGSAVFIISEWCEGHSLRTLLQSQQEVAHPLIVYYMQQVAAGLDYLHSQGFCHRDFTLQRVLIDPGGTAKLIDVGLLGVIPDIDRQGGLEGVERGYISPEELLGFGPSPEADRFRFSVGCYELLAGMLPFLGNTPAELRESILSQSRVLPASQRRKLPSHLLKFFQKALSVNAEDRPGTAAELIKPVAQSSTRYSGLGGLGQDLDRLRARSSFLSRMPRPVVFAGFAGLVVLLGLAISSTHLVQLLHFGDRSQSESQLSVTPVKMGTDEAPVQEAPPISPDSRSNRSEPTKLSSQMLGVAHQRTGGEKELLPFLREMMTAPPSTPITVLEQQLLRSMLGHDNPALRHFVVRIIERRNVTELSEPLIGRLYDGDPGVRSAAIRALQVMAVPVPLKTLALRAAAESSPSVHAKLLELAEGLAAESKMGKDSGR